MNHETNLDEFIKDCIAGAEQEADDEKAITGFETLVAIFVYAVIRPMLPEIRGWLELAIIPIDLKRQEIRKKLEVYAVEKELDFKQAEKAANAIVKNISVEKLKKLV
ncbi:MAG: hypothetical protein BWK80_25035 [Desulfobacteraceae bacterium IS3]|nr:MAG: hypothetical protein BWK80_25035 [Desulfobacteraceae bacterium IS3]